MTFTGAPPIQSLSRPFALQGQELLERPRQQHIRGAPAQDNGALSAHALADNSLPAYQIRLSR